MNSIIGVDGTVDEARALLGRAERADGNSPVSDQALLAASQGQRQLNLFYAHDDAARESPLAVGVIGEGELDLVVDPAARGQGIGSAALTTLLETVSSASSVLAWAHGKNPAADALLSRAGFSPVRSLFRMVLDPALLPGSGAAPLATSVPDGYALRTYGTRPSDAAEWVRANAIAFADHPEQGRVTEADFALMREEPWFDAEDLFLLSAPPKTSGEEGTGLAGYTWVKTVRGGAASAQPETELYVIGVDPAHAGKGLGRTLLDVTLTRMAQHNPSAVSLYVDGENERAVNLYLSAGFTIDSRSRQWRRVSE